MHTHMKKKQNEKDTDRYIAYLVCLKGGLYIKLDTSLIAGLPDRLIVLKDCRPFFAEIKSEGKKPSIVQKLMHSRLRAMGHRVYVVSTTRQADAMMKDIYCTPSQYDEE